MKDLLNKIHHADCMELIEKLPDNVVDCLFSDVPYLIAKGGCSLTSTYGTKNKWSKDPKKLELFRTGKMFGENDILPGEYLPAFFRVLKEKAHIYIMVNSLHLAPMINEMQKVGFNINNILVMQKNNCVTNQWYMKDIEFVVFARKGGARPLNNMSLKSCIQVQMPTEKIHETQKPLDYVKLLINNSTQEGDLVLDPFSGSATTALACHDLNLNFICIEKDEKYHAASVDRLAQHQRQLKLI